MVSIVVVGAVQEACVDDKRVVCMSGIPSTGVGRSMGYEWNWVTAECA